MEPESILTPEEMESMRTVQTLYGAQAKLAANQLTENLGLSEETQTEFVGRVAIGLESLDFERRKHVADLFVELTHSLDVVEIGEPTQDTPRPSGLPIFVPAIEEETPPTPVSNGSKPTDSESEKSIHNGNGSHLVHDTQIATETERSELAKPQLAWLEGVLGEEGAARVAALSDPHRLEFTQNLGNTYINLKIARLSTEDKVKRSQQMSAFIAEGKSYKEIAEQEQCEPATLSAAMRKMITSISSRTEQADLIALIPNSDTAPIESSQSDTTLAETESEPEVGKLPYDESEFEPQEFTKLQHNWFSKVFGKENFGLATVNTLQTLSTSQRMHLASKLNKHVRAHSAKKDGTYVAGRKEDEVALLIQGKTIEEISESVARPEVAVNQELHVTAITINQNVSIEELRSMLASAAEYPTESRNGSGL
ncbi:MAG: hypothetical protein U0524_02620 [Candidatus Saccharimonadales bacterium]